MQTEIDSQTTLRPVRILGVNGVGLESGNEGMTTGQALPWLQPSEDEDVWTLWQVGYRDVFIVGSGNEHRSTFNLTINDLADPENYATLMTQLLTAANE